MSFVCLFHLSPGVIEDFKVDMEVPTSHYMVGRCFVATEPGTYFDGTGYVKAGMNLHPHILTT